MFAGCATRSTAGSSRTSARSGAACAGGPKGCASFSPGTTALQPSRTRRSASAESRTRAHRLTSSYAAGRLVTCMPSSRTSRVRGSRRSWRSTSATWRRRRRTPDARARHGPSRPASTSRPATTPGGRPSVRRAVAAAVALKPPTLGFPVDCLDAGTAFAASPEKAEGAGAGFLEKKKAALRECVLLKPGSTVLELFAEARRVGACGNCELVRSETSDGAGEAKDAAQGRARGRDPGGSGQVLREQEGQVAREEVGDTCASRGEGIGYVEARFGILSFTVS